MEDFSHQSPEHISTYHPNEVVFPSPSSVDNIPQPAKKYRCGHCSASFQRREHFERHSRSHTKIKDFHCDFCTKSFGRRDTLQRHLVTHGQVPAKVRKPSARVSRACANCMKSKQRCSGSPPCERCSRKGWNCVLPDDARPVSYPDVTDILGSNSPGMRIPAIQNVHHEECLEESQRHATSMITGPHPCGASNEAPASLALANEIRLAPYDSEATAIFDSFLLWPMDDDGRHSDTTWAATSDVDLARGSARVVEPLTQFSEAGRTPGLAHPSSPSPSTFSDAQRSFSNGLDVRDGAIGEEYEDILASEDYGHVPRPPIATYEHMCASSEYVSRSLPGCNKISLPALEVLHVCAQLYFEHFHRGFPLLHQGTFEVGREGWLLYLAVAAVGSQYSRLLNRGSIATSLLDIVRAVVLSKLASGASLQNNLELAQTLILFNLALLLSGTREGVMHVQYQRNLLVTMCRPLLVPGLLFERNTVVSGSTSVRDWSRWIALESWRRVAYFTWLSESIQLVLFDLPPLISVEDMQISLPCNDEIWQCANFDEWERIKNSRTYPQQNPSLVDLLRTGGIHNQGQLLSLSETTHLIIALAVYTVERQGSCQQAIQTCNSRSDNLQPRTLGERGEDPDKSTDSILGHFQAAFSNRSGDSAVFRLVNKFSCGLQLTRFIPYRLMYVASGWMAEHQEAEAATQRISQLLQTEHVQARQNMVHAVRLFQMIRSQPQFDPYDPFIFLMAVLYIWYYDRLVISGQNRAANTELLTRMLRIDQELNDGSQKQWIEGNTEVAIQLHISGVGVLDGRDSVSRILREASRILDHDGAWCRQSKAIKMALRQILSGEAPSFPK